MYHSIICLSIKQKWKLLVHIICVLWCRRRPLPLQSIGREVHVSTRSFHPHGPKNSNQFFYFPIGKSAPTSNSHGNPSLHLVDRTLRLCSVSGQALDSRIPETRQHSTLTLSFSFRDFFPIAISPVMMSRNLVLRLSNPDMLKL
jgi:hypothetical protein